MRASTIVDEMLYYVGQTKDAYVASRLEDTVQPYEDGSLASTWFALMPWEGGSVIEGLAEDAWELSGER